MPIQTGGACSLCGAGGTNKTTCPFNPNAKHPDESKHGRAVNATAIAARPVIATARPAPGKLSASLVPKPLLKDGRMAAGAYYKTYGHTSIGDICDIRGDGTLKCLLLRTNGVPYWASASKKGTGQESCAPWAKKCMH